MERLSLNESPANAQRNPQQQQQQQQFQQQNSLGPAGQMPTSGPPQLPPQMFTTAAQLLDLTDSRLTKLEGSSVNDVPFTDSGIFFC